MKNALIITIIFVLLTSCSNEDHFFLESDGADMPLTVAGNTSSQVFILFLHGGPGNGAFVWREHFQKLEKKFAMVYWDQRAAGSSQGNAQPASMTVQTMVQDTHKAVTLINHLYDRPAIYLMGHSWGGLLGTAYLIQYPEEVKGWIEVDGAHNKVQSASYSKKWVMDYAINQIEKGVNTHFWEEALQWYDQYEGLLTYSSKHYTTYLPAAHAYFYKDNYRYYGLSDYFFGSPNGFDLLLNGKFSDQHLEQEIVSTDLTPLMAKVTIPSLICWGKHDGAIPHQMARDAYDALGTAESLKTIVYFEESAHSPMIEENQLFCSTVIDFVDRIERKRH
jgi:proline iminopeptidase